MTEAEREAALIPRLTDEFLATLTEAARISGWSIDYMEVCGFVGSCYRLAGKPAPDELRQPYEFPD